MSVPFNAPNPQTNTTPATSASISSSLFGTSGAGDAAKPLMSSNLFTSPKTTIPISIFQTSQTTAQPTQYLSNFGVPVPLTPVNTVASQLPKSTFSFDTISASRVTTSTTSTTAPTEFATAATTKKNISFNFGNMTTSDLLVGSTLASTTANTAGFSTFKNTVSGTGFGSFMGPATTTATTITMTSATGGFTGSITGTTSAPTSTIFGMGTTAPSTTSTPTSSIFGMGTTVPSTKGFFLGTGTTAASTTGFSLNQTSVTQSLTSTQASLGTTTTVTSSAGTLQPASISSFEELINKWTLELEEQEKVFVNQAAQVNAWDKLLIRNAERIVILNQEVEKVKIEQQQLEHELDYVVGQQKELQDCLVPLEKELASLSVSDPEREYTYRLAEDLDTQLKRMSEDLKEIIEHLNQANRTQDFSDPVVQIGKILNAHMNMLQWLDRQTSLANHKMQLIDRMHQNFRQENERNFSLAYN